MIITDRSQIGERLYKLRKIRHLTQFEAASLSGISGRTYADIERGLQDMKVDTLCKICMGLRISPNDLLVEKEPRESLSDEEILLTIRNSSSADKQVIHSLVTAYLQSSQAALQ